MTAALAFERTGDRDTVEIPNRASLSVAQLERKALALGDVERDNLSSFLGGTHSSIERNGQGRGSVKSDEHGYAVHVVIDREPRP